MWHVACGTCRSALRPKGKIAGITRARRLDREALEDILLEGRFEMALDLENMGTLVVHIDATWNFAGGPIAGRSCSAFRERFDRSRSDGRFGRSGPCPRQQPRRGAAVWAVHHMPNAGATGANSFAPSQTSSTRNEPVAPGLA